MAFDMGFDIINGPEPAPAAVERRIKPQTKWFGDSPNNAIIQEIYENMTCMDVLNYATYVFYRRTQEVKFGQKAMSLEEVCSLFPQCPARSMAVVAEVGPPNRRGFRTVTIAQLINDWYWQAKSAKNKYVMDKFDAALKNRGIQCKI